MALPSVNDLPPLPDILQTDDIVVRALREIRATQPGTRPPIREVTDHYGAAVGDTITVADWRAKCDPLTPRGFKFSWWRRLRWDIYHWKIIEIYRDGVRIAPEDE